MEIVLADDYEPVGDESFSLLHFGSLSETFSQVTFSGNGLEWDDMNLYSDGVLPVHPTNSLPGDANQDGVVDIADIVHAHHQDIQLALSR